jgi:PPR repeat family/Pentatricopeptide repeat domain
MIMLEEQGHDIHVDAASFTAVIDALSKSEDPDALQKAGQLIDRMEELAAGGNSRLAPTVVTYNSFINVLAKSRNKGAGRIALGVLQRMKDHHGIEPTTISFNSVISALVHSGSDESDAVMRLMSQMKGSTTCKPTTITYNAVLHVISQSHRGDAVQLAQSLLHEMQQDILTFPSTITYNTIMQIYAKRSLQDGAERIEEMLTYLEDDKELHPNKQSYTTAITAWARSQSPEKVQRAFSILERMKAAYVSGNQTCEPDIIVYNALLNCCCFPIGSRDEAARVTMKAYSDIQESGYGPPDSITYSCTLQSLGRSMQVGDEKETWLKRVFDDACKDGLVNDLVLEQLAIASATLFEKVVAENGGDRTRCPKAWSRRVNRQRRAPR